MTTSVVGGTPKRCSWCEEEIPKPRKISASEWAAKHLHKQCVVSWRHHKCAKKDIEHPPDRWCPTCQNLLVRREGENWQAWKKRQYCDKSCAAFGSTRIRRPVAVVVQEEQVRVGCVQYIPGSPEFQQIAALYGG